MKSFKDATTNENKLYLSVKDNGVGIPEEEKKKFSGVFTSPKPPEVSRKWTKRYRHRALFNQADRGNPWGTIGVKNNRKAGVSFRVILPLHEENPHSLTPKTATGHEPVKNVLKEQNLKEWQKERLTFLVVEDNRDMCRYICSVLSPYYNTLEANNGVEALEILEDYHVDFIISDLMMPEMDGLQLSKKVKENFTLSHIPFLMLTAKTSEKTRTDSYGWEWTHIS